MDVFDHYWENKTFHDSRLFISYYALIGKVVSKALPTFFATLKPVSHYLLILALGHHNFSTDAWEGSGVLVTGSHFYDERSSMFVTPPPGIQVHILTLLP